LGLVFTWVSIGLGARILAESRVMQNTSAPEGGTAGAARAHATPTASTASPPAQSPTRQQTQSQTQRPAPPGLPEAPAVVSGAAPGDAEIGGPAGPEPTRYGDWEKNGRCIDF
jgi:hypothetical protein